MNAQRKNRGFTLIELVVVIAILAILAAFALPRFAQLSEQAHRSNVKATAGALSASVALVKAQWVTNGFTEATDDLEGFGNDDIDVSSDGWPVSTNGANNPSNLTDTICESLWEGLLQSNAPEVGTSGTGIEYLASASGTTCEYAYQADGRTTNIRQIIYDADTGEVTTNNVD